MAYTRSFHMMAPLINIGEFYESFKQLAFRIDPGLEAIACDLSCEDVKLTNYEQVEQTDHIETSKDNSFIEGGPVTEMDRNMTASVVSPGGHPQPILARPATSNGQASTSSTTKQAEVAYEQVEEGDVIITIAIYHNHKAQKSQEFKVLGSHPLTTLRDCIYCLSDYTSEGGKTKSSYMFVENTFYDDLRDEENIEYSKYVIEWAETNRHGSEREDAPGFSSKQMQNTTFKDLSLRMNIPYLYCHQGSCEHLIIITDIRLLNEGDDHNKNSYPLQTFQAKIRRRKCKICDISFECHHQTQNLHTCEDFLHTET